MWKSFGGPFMDGKHIKQYSKILKAGASEVLSQVSPYYRGNWIVDVGCNTGAFIECVLEKFPSAPVVGFEPVRRYCEYARSKFHTQSNVFIEDTALGDEDGADLIHVARQNIGWNTLVREKVDEDNAREVESIRIVRFDDWWARRGVARQDVKVDIVKIDVEGYEHKVLRGMMEFLKEQKPVIACEVGWGCGHPHWEEELAAFEWLYSIGYNRGTEDRVKGLQETTDVVFRVEG
jgi:FkbM family methyltransferase